ncbi:MAG TPA: DUF2891 domain-containing protein [Stellaceae bacterium]|nr:DUF2891 domain-containing protein [Stellaceae bacterium]
MAAVLTPDLASRFARIARAHVTREYPNKLEHTMRGPEDVRSPRSLHPIFYGSFDWHSCVHGYWLLCRLYRRFPAFPERPGIRDLADHHLTPANVAGELDYLRTAPGFERPYGWAWLLMLAAELAQHDSSEGRRWRDALTPLADEFVDRFLAFLPVAKYPVRSGAHYNSAFALTLAWDYAQVCRHDRLRDLVRDKSCAWFGQDADCQAWEPSGDDFVSPALMEAECMRRVLPAADFPAWFDRFLPRLGSRIPATLFEPATVTDRTDGKTVHLDGLNFSRAWCWRSIAAALPEADPRRSAALAAADAHLDTSLPYIAGDYMGEHWLATFALLALDG